MEKEIDIEEEKFQALLEQKRHNEIKNLLSRLTAVMADKDDTTIANAINGQGSKIIELVKAIQNMPKPDYNQKEFASLLQEICDDIVNSNTKVVETLENRLLPDTFDLIKDYSGFTQSVKVNYKKANQIIIKK